MPKQKETVELNVDGQLFTAWEQVRATSEFGTFREFSFLATEAISTSGGKSSPNWSTLQIKPGMSCTIKLANQLFITGKVRCRTAMYNETQHNVLIAGASDAYIIVDAAATMKDNKGGQQSGTLKDIATKTIKKVGPDYIQKGKNPYSEIPYDDTQIWPGESVMGYIKRLARTKAVTLMDDEKGNVIGIAGLEDAGSGGDLVEGQNILAATARIEDTTIYSSMTNFAAKNGNDKVWGRAACQAAAHADNPGYQTYKPMIDLADRPQLTEDCKGRTDFESLWSLNDNIDVDVTVYGWQKNGGDLWKVTDTVHIDAPMLMLTGATLGAMPLYIKRVEFTQTNEGGSLSRIKLVNKLSITQTSFALNPTPGPAKAGPA